ncbi:hypothetical protein E2556_09835 [Staphylococcus croceilyticus]|uniref:Phage abortive infection protein n=1 Tax=Staphylococcus croceilyticus TaxID=319942 RepID=A0ABY2KE41_9STAP|nr:hypothetical protein [Staphylococcus croceilyticus]PNZ65901.1 hypothetical protein CD128_11135 [Staphylococcus croceilyticus]TGA74373.1 hypothetical protein E2556_09835 [Staphylococcus croceilyticus]
MINRVQKYIEKNERIIIISLIILVFLCLIVLFIELITLDNRVGNDISYITIFISIISIVTTTILSVFLYLANIKANRINESVLEMTKQQNNKANHINESVLKITKQQNNIQNFLILSEKRGEQAKNIKRVEEYIKFARVLDLFCYTNFSTYDQLLTLRKHKVLQMPTELNQFTDLNLIKIPNLNISEETLLKHNLHDPKMQKYKDINKQFYDLLPNSVLYQYNIMYLKEVVEKLSGIIDDELISKYQEGIFVQKQIEFFKLNFFNELLDIDNSYKFYNTNYDYTKAKIISICLQPIKRELNRMIEEIKKEYGVLKKYFN